MEILPVLNAFISNEKCSLEIAISKIYFKKYSSVGFSQMTLLNFFQQLGTAKTNKSLPLRRSSFHGMCRLHRQLHVFVCKISSSCTFYILKTDEN